MGVTEIESAFDKTDKGFLDPIGMSNLQRAYKGRKKEVSIGGIKYSIEYGFSRVYPASGERMESVRLKRVDGEFAPMGYVSVKRILQFKFEDETT